jgi:predicted nucleic acid-binding protein
VILVDTSVWIDWLRGTGTAATEALDHVLSNALPFGIAGVIYQEILQGADSLENFQRLAAYFGTQRFYHPKDQVETHTQAASIYMHCRRHGITIRSTVDCLIAQLALEYDLLLLHSDRDFARIQEVAPALRFFPTRG